MERTEEIRRVENAGRGLAQTALGALGPGWRSARVVVLAGKDLTAAAGVLAGRHLVTCGVDVRLCLAGPGPLDAPAAHQRKAFLGAGGTELDLARPHKDPPDLVLEALGERPLEGGPDAVFARWAHAHAELVLSLDLPARDPQPGADLGRAGIRPLWTVRLAQRRGSLSLDRLGEVFLSGRVSLSGLPAGLK